MGRAATGSRMASWGPSEVAGAGVDDAARLGVKVDGAALHEGLAGARAGERPWFEVMREFGADVGVEIVSADLDGLGGDALPPVVATPGQVRCPRRLEVTPTPQAWDELLGGVGVACAPVVVVGTVSAGGKALRVGEHDVALLELAEACAEVEARCVLVGCPAARAGACVEQLEESLLDSPLQPELPAYVRGFVARALTQEVAPVVIAQLAAVDGSAQLVIARPGAASEGQRRSER